MNTRPFFQVVPKSVQLWAWITVVATVVIALTMGILTIAAHHGSLWTIPLYTIAGLFTGTLFAIWLLGLGFVYADARRRAMHPVLWVLVCPSGSASVGVPALFRAASTPRITLWSLRTNNSFRPAILLVVRDSPASPAHSRCTLPLRPDSRNQPLTARQPS